MTSISISLVGLVCWPNSWGTVLEIQRENIEETFKQFSTDYIRQATGEKNLVVSPEELLNLRYNQFFSGIAVFTNTFRVVFRAHYFLEDIEQLVHVPSEQRNLYSYIDSVNEFCNVVAGRSMTELLGKKDPFGMSIPFSMEGFNQLFFEREGIFGAANSWAISAKSIKIQCSLLVSVTS